MQQETELGYKSAGYFGRGAAINAELRNRENRAKYTADQRQRAQSLYDLLDSVYEYDSMYLNYRKTFAAVKIEGAKFKDGFARKLEQQILEQGDVEKILTEQGMIYRVKFG